MIELPVLTAERILSEFPSEGKFADGARPEQVLIIRAIGDGKSLIEGPTGIGKSPIEYAVLKTALKAFGGVVFWIAPTKAIVEQLHTDFPDVKVVYGSDDTPCLYAARGYNAQVPVEILPERLLDMTKDRTVPRRSEVPCALINRQCEHYVDPDTGLTRVPGATPCPYYQSIAEAKKGGIVLATMSFYLHTQLFGKHFDTPKVLVIDEGHRLADVIRYTLSYEITDWHIQQSVDLLTRVGLDNDARTLQRFLGTLRRIAQSRRRDAHEEHLLEEEEVRRLIEILELIDESRIKAAMQEARRTGTLSPSTDGVVLKKLEDLTRDIPRYVRAFEFSLGTEERRPLNYICAFYRAEKGEKGKTQYKLIVRAHHVAPLIRKRLLAEQHTLVFSATIGNPEIFRYETGIGSRDGMKDAFFTLPSTFSTERTRLYMPTDTLNLSFGEHKKRGTPKMLRLVATACQRFAQQGHRSLVVVISNHERERFLTVANEVGLQATSYGNGKVAMDVAKRFRDGHGDVLVGTAANYGEGVDLPKQVAPVIFFLRPSFPNPYDALSQFENRRYKGGQIWAVRMWRAMVQALQVRGRNVRGPRDLGVTFFISQQFRKVVYPALPEWLQPAYRGEWSWEECLVDAEQLLVSSAETHPSVALPEAAAV